MSVETGGQLATTPSNGAEQKSASAFDPANFGPVTLIMLMRLYDLGLAFLSAIDPDRAAELIGLHAKGHTFCPPPHFIEYDDDETDA